MAINVVCPGCHSRFAVSEKFAGKKGPCPKCKKVIEIPKPDQQIKVHEREYGGAKGASGQLVLKPIERTKFRFRPVAVAGVVVPVLIVFGMAAWIGSAKSVDEIDSLILGLGAVALAAPLVFGGYTFLRDDEKEPYRGMELATRVAVCTAAYALLWGGFALVPKELRTPGGVEAAPSTTADAESYLSDKPPPETKTGADAGFEPEEPKSDFITVALVIVPFLAAGAGIAYGVLDLELAAAVFHYLLYLFACVACRLLMGLNAI